MTVKASGHNKTLEGLRGLSALLVIISHLIRMPAQEKYFAAVSARNLVPYAALLGQAGVMLFFMISGFLILQSLVRHGDIRRFFVNRASRIYPVFLPLHLSLFIIGPILGYEWMGTLRGDAGRYTVSFLANLFFLPGVLPLPIAQKNAWSLSFEMFFYVAAAVGFLLCKLWRHHGWRGFPAVLAYSALLIAFVVWQPMALFFVAGVTAFVLRTRQFSPKLITALRWASLIGFPAMFVALSFSTPLAALCGGIVFLALSREWGEISRLLQKRVFLFLGQISYSLYLIHPFVLSPLRSLFQKIAPHLGNPYLTHALFAVTGLVASVAMGYVSYRLIEVEFTRRYLSRSRGDRQPPANLTNVTAARP